MSASTPSVNEPASPHSKAKANYKSTSLRKLVTSGINDVVIASVYSEKTRLKKMVMITRKMVPITGRAGCSS